MSWAAQRDRLLGKAPSLSLDDVMQLLRDRDAVLVVQDGHLEYLGPDLADDDPLHAGIEAHRALLTELFTFAPGGRCMSEGCHRLLAAGDKIACEDHRRQLDEERMPWEGGSAAR